MRLLDFDPRERAAVQDVMRAYPFLPDWFAVPVGTFLVRLMLQPWLRGKEQGRGE